MRVYKDCDWTGFEFWSGAKDTVALLTEEEMETVWEYLEDMNPDGLSETEINDFFWFGDDEIADLLGWPDFETLLKARSRGKWYDSYDEYCKNEEE